MQYIVGIDVGTSGCKSIVIDDLGKVVIKATEEYPLSIPRPGWSEQETADWWRAVKNTICKISKDFDSPRDIKAIGLSGQMHGLVALDAADRVLRPAILWNDQRTGKQCQDIYDRVGGADELLKLTNNRMLPGYTGGKILWVRENEPRIYGKMALVLNPKDYIRLCLTGEYATEVSDASGTGLFDVRKRRWSVPLLEKLDIPRDMLPKCYESSEVSGTLSPTIADELGLPAGVPVVGGGGDSVIQTTGTGLIEPGILGTTIGTAGIVAMALDKCFDNPDGKLQVFCNNMPNTWHCMGVTLAAGGSLRWLRDTLWDAKQKAKTVEEDDYGLLTREAEKAEPGSEGLLFLPYLIGERCPHPDPKAKGAFVGLTLRHERRHIIRSVLECVIYSLRDVAELIKDTGIPVSQIRTSGGGAVSDLWRQIHADIFGGEVITVSGSSEGGAYGAALVAGVGTGVWGNMEEAVKVVKPEKHTTPIREHTEIYDLLFPIYRNLYYSLKDTFDGISEIYGDL